MIENVEISKLLDVNHTIAKLIFKDVNYPWQIIPRIKDFILELGPTLSRSDFEEAEENVWIAKSAKIFKTAYIGAPTIICPNAEVRHGAFIRSCAIVGKNCVVGNSTELKNVILFDDVQVPHYNYVGDSVLGYKSHLGAGAITSNVKSDRSMVTVSIGGQKIQTGLKKFGAILGDGVEVGCNSVLNPGSIIGRSSNIYPLSTVRGFIVENSIYKSKDNIVKKNRS